MRLATRTGLASFVAASIMLLACRFTFRGHFASVLQERVDRQLRRNGPRRRRSLLPSETASHDASSTGRWRGRGSPAWSTGAAPTGSSRSGRLPVGELPPIETPGWTVASADGEDWRLYTVEVFDVPEIGDRALVQTRRPARRCRRTGGRPGRRAIVIGSRSRWRGVDRLSAGYARRPTALAASPRLRTPRRGAAGWLAGAADYGTQEVDDMAQCSTRTSSCWPRRPPVAGRHSSRHVVRGVGGPRVAHAAAERTPRASTSHGPVGSTRRR